MDQKITCTFDYTRLTPRENYGMDWSVTATVTHPGEVGEVHFVGCAPENGVSMLTRNFRMKVYGA
jgi:hypothetical protein